GLVRLTVEDIAGRLVTTLLDRPLDPGLHAVDWNGIGAAGLPVASGRYLYTLQTPGGIERRSMIVLK
ncbi:MAG: galactose oxidase, partial [Planctomycetaceae bacterium]|nr:galactose oxidase [Planctomycetaceae bacterium]